jgi:cytochrome c biogenesis protein CcmG, thiol:disulfide interchange protein DsbE
MPRALTLSLRGVALVAVLGLLALLVWRVVHQSKPVKLGARAPAFDLVRLDGNARLASSSLAGKVRVINFWASWCGPCKAESPALERLWRQYRADGVAFVGIDYNDVTGDARRFVERHGLTYPMVRDRDGMTGDRYDITAVPETFVVDRRGRLVDHLLGPIDKGDNVDAFAQALRTALRS